jgi:DNA-3-methyladenine glycosylase I
MRAIVGSDGLRRCPWGARDGVLMDYHDAEWGIPVVGEQAYFERLSLEGFQAGLSWLTVLNKRQRFREVFSGFEVDVVAAMSDAELEAALEDSGIIRNRAKIFATRHNARAVANLREKGGLPSLIESFRPDHSPQPIDSDEVPAISEESRRLSSALKREGLKFVGPTTAHALMEALGLIDTHLVDCHRRGSGRS